MDFAGGESRFFQDGSRSWRMRNKWISLVENGYLWWAQMELNIQDFPKWISLGKDAKKMDLARWEWRLWGDFGGPWGSLGKRKKQQKRGKKREGRRNTTEARRKKEAPTRKENKNKIYIYKLPINRFCGAILYNTRFEACIMHALLALLLHRCC